MMKILVLAILLLTTGCVSPSAKDVPSEINATQRLLRQIGRLDTVPDISILATIEEIQKAKRDKKK